MPESKLLNQDFKLPLRVRKMTEDLERQVAEAQKRITAINLQTLALSISEMFESIHGLSSLKIVHWAELECGCLLVNHLEAEDVECFSGFDLFEVGGRVEEWLEKETSSLMDEMADPCAVGLFKDDCAGVVDRDSVASLAERCLESFMGPDAYERLLVHERAQGETDLFNQEIGEPKTAKKGKSRRI